MSNLENTKDIFSGLEHLGFNNISNLKLYKDNNSDTNVKKSNQPPEDETEKAKNFLYDRDVTCPVCNNKFKARSVKTSAARVIKKDSDFFIRYGTIDPYFYDVWICNICGYSAMKKDFDRVKSYQIEKIQKNISLKWKGRKYPDVYDINIAIERYKLSLLNYCIMEAKSSSKAMNCLKLAWMYRLSENYDSEQIFLKQALEGFNDAYYNEEFPIFGMDRFTTMYLIGELNRRVLNSDEALLWLSKVITTPSVPQKLKELARDQKELIKDSAIAQKEMTDMNQLQNKKNSLFSRLFK